MKTREALVKLENIALALQHWKVGLGETGCRNIADQLYEIRDALIDAGVLTMQDAERL